MSAKMIMESYPATAASVAAARRDVLEFLAGQDYMSSWTLEGIALVVSEAVSNVVKHAYAEGGSVWVEVQVDADELRLSVSDNGRGMQEGPALLGAGLGLRYMRAFCDGMVVEDRATGGVTVRTRFLLA